VLQGSRPKTLWRDTPRASSGAVTGRAQISEAEAWERARIWNVSQDLLVVSDLGTHQFGPLNREAGVGTIDGPSGR
jgi:hypothetical protein